MIYIIIVLLILVGIVCFDYANYIRGRKGYYLFLYILLVLIAGLRYKVGGDTFFYMEYWETNSTLSDLFEYGFGDLSGAYQPLWYLLSALCRSLSSDFVVFQIVHAIIVNSIFAWFFWKYAKLPFFATLLYALFFYLYYNTEVMRASLAVSMILLGYPALQNKKWLKYYFWCIIALGFHLSATFCFVFPVFHILKRLDWKWIFAFIVVGFVLSYASSFLPFVLNLVESNENLFAKIEHYGTEIEGDIYGGYNIVGWIVWFCTVVIVPIFFLYFSDNQKNNCFRGCLFVFVLLMVMAKAYGNLTIRLTDFLFPFYLILMVNVSYEILKTTKSVPYALSRFVLFFVLLIFTYDRVSYRYMRPLAHGYFYQLWYPYTSVFDKKEPVEREDLLYLYRQ